MPASAFPLLEGEMVRAGVRVQSPVLTIRAVPMIRRELKFTPKEPAFLAVRFGIMTNHHTSHGIVCETGRWTSRQSPPNAQC